MKIRSLLVCLLALVLFGSSNPDPYPDDYFRSPLGIPLYLSGGFAEMRSNHFHGGLDIKTQGQTGYRVYGAADGWISRIVISPSGYGNALYVSHPNGYMTVYGHLDRFRNDIQEFMKGLQYERQSFNVEYFPNKGQFSVQKGEEIALSGNSGGSAGPHLHFEIRDERTGFPVNPQLWGFDIKDNTPPRIFRVKVYALGANSSVRLRDSKTKGWVRVGPGDDAIMDVTRINGEHVLSRVDRIEASGEIGFAIQANDYHEGSSNRLGLYTTQLTNNGSTLFRSSMDRFSFDQTRYINAHADYAELRKSGRWFERSFVLPGNKLPLYQTASNGHLQVRSQEKHLMEYVITDAVGNTTTLDFTVFGTDPENPIVKASATSGSSFFHIAHDQDFSYRADGFALNMPHDALYEDDEFEYNQVSSDASNIYSNIHVVHKPHVPIHSWVTMEIVPTRLPVELQSKAGIVRVRSNGSVSWAGGSFDRGVIRTRIRAFDRYAVGIDDQKPTISPINISAGKNMAKSSEIRVRIRDGMSGIDSYTGKIDGKWVLFEYDAKNALLVHKFDSSTTSGPHTLDLVVTDNTGNSNSLSLPFVR